MKSQGIEGKLRQFLLLMAGLVFVATFTELVLAEHTREPIQYLPFVLCATGLITVVAAWLRPKRATLLALRVVMVVAALGGLIGITIHLLENLSFERDVHPNATAINTAIAAFKGAAPLEAQVLQKMDRNPD